jgi:DNA-3-methyladenine glycosylase I
LGVKLYDHEGARCGWVNPADALYSAYHDEEWGVPEYDPRALWEKLVLDGFQAGLAWITILRKREAFRAAFANFDSLKTQLDKADPSYRE